MITCAIIDDEPLALDLLESYVQKTPSLQLQGRYASATEAMDALRSHPVNLVFLDIQMPELNGLELSRVLPPDTRIVFTTAFSDYALEGYKVSALDYLMKPIAYADFLAAVSKAERWFARPAAPIPASANTLHVVNAQEGSIFVKSEYKVVRLELNDILYIEGLKDYIKIYTHSTPRAILSLSSMHAIEAALPSDTFLRVHRSYVVNMSRVNLFEKGQIVFGEKHIPISDSYKDIVQEYILRHMPLGR